MSSRPQGKTYYAVLGITPAAGEEDIQRAYEDMQKVVGEIIDPKQRADRMQQLQQAYETLLSPVRRSVYDASLQAGQAATIELAQSAPAKSARSTGLPGWMILAGSLLIGGIGFAGWKIWGNYAADREYRETFRVAQRQSEALRAEAEHLIEREAQAAQRAASYGKPDPDYETRRIEENRQDEYDSWDRKKRYEAESANRQAEYEARRRQSQAEYEARQQDQREERDTRAAQERVERERQYLLNKLINEKRFDEARNIAKTSYELDRINQLEKYR